MKKCSQCKESKLIEDFYRDRSTYDGLSVRCRPCARAHSSATVKQRRARGVKHPRSAEPKVCSNCKYLCDASMFGTDTSRPDGLNVTCKQCRAAQRAGRPSEYYRMRKYKISHPDQRRARNAISKAVARKLIKRAQEHGCFICKRQADHYHHHLGYTWEYRYHVIPVCVSCHSLIDRGVITVQISNMSPVYTPRPTGRRP